MGTEGCGGAGCFCFSLRGSFHFSLLSSFIFLLNFADGQISRCALVHESFVTVLVVGRVSISSHVLLGQKQGS